MVPFADFFTELFVILTKIAGAPKFKKYAGWGGGNLKMSRASEFKNLTPHHQELRYSPIPSDRRLNILLSFGTVGMPYPNTYPKPPNDGLWDEPRVIHKAPFSLLLVVWIDFH